MNRNGRFRLSIVIPAFEEAENIPALLASVAANSTPFPEVEIIVVDDGSSDGSLDVLRRSIGRHPNLRFVALSKNYGHQTALRAGMEHATGDCVICLDADLQHPPELIEIMVSKWQHGADIVTCIRQDPGTVPLFKRATSLWFYSGLSWISGLQLMPGASDFRLLDRKLMDILNQLQECDLFYRGVIPTLGFNVAIVDYVPNERKRGRSKYTLRKMVKLALNGVISSTVRPLRLATYFAFATALGAVSFLGYVLYIYFVTKTGVPGWASTLAVVLTIGTMQLLVLGVIGEYLGQVLKEARRRPPFHVAETGGVVGPWNPSPKEPTHVG